MISNSIERNLTISSSVNSLGVFLLGVEHKMQNALVLFFKNKCNNKFHITKNRDAVITIVDIDNRKSQQIWKKYVSNHPERHIIILSLHKFNAKDAGIVIRKPINTNQLLSAVEKISETIEKSTVTLENQASRNVDGNINITPVQNIQDENYVTQQSRSLKNPETTLTQNDKRYFISTAPDIDINDPKQILKTQYDPKLFLAWQIQRAINTAKDKKRPVKLLSIYRDTIIIDPQKNSVLTGINERRLRTLASVPHPETKFSLSILRNSDLKSAEYDDYICHDIESIIWKMALWSARGRVPAGTDITHPIILDSWPNLTRLQVFPHAINIAAFLIQQPQSLINTAKILNIPQRCVFSFYSAANAIGLAYPAKPNEFKEIQQPHIKQHKERKFLSRIIEKLRVLSDS